MATLVSAPPGYSNSSGSMNQTPKRGRYCICRGSYDGKEFMISCDGCEGTNRFFHDSIVKWTSMDSFPLSVIEHS
jgi:hypothetical protein